MKLRVHSLLQLSAMLLLFFSACIDEDYDDCPQGLIISLYSKSPCQSAAIYPAAINDVTLGIFDRNDVLVTSIKRSNIELSENYNEVVEVGSGLYTVVAWSGVDESDFDVNALKEGQTKKDDLYFRLKRAQAEAQSIEDKQVYFGESPAVYVENTKSEADFAKALVNMQEITNRVTVIVEGLTAAPDEYEVIVESNNGSMNVGGSIAADEVIAYSSVLSPETNLLKVDFTLLKLETGYTNTLVVRERATENELFRGSLLGTLILKNPEVNLNCDHDFTIRFTAEDQCNCGTYAITEIWVNNWLVHSYDTGM